MHIVTASNQCICKRRIQCDNDRDIHCNLHREHENIIRLGDTRMCFRSGCMPECDELIFVEIYYKAYDDRTSTTPPTILIDQSMYTGGGSVVGSRYGYSLISDDNLLEFERSLNIRGIQCIVKSVEEELGATADDGPNAFYQLSSYFNMDCKYSDYDDYFESDY